MPQDVASIALVVLGIGFLIFVHELGHFVVAKLVGIRVLGFSIGFGPRVIGFRRGETDYRISLFPIGGYVKMVGETPEDGDLIEDGDFRSKTVGQRAAVLSAGVIMNAIFAFVLFAAAFSIGVPFDKPVVGAVVEGDSAWRAGFEVDDRILSVGGKKIYGFADVRTEIAVSKGSDVDVVVARNGDQKTLAVRPEKNDATGLFMVGLLPHPGTLAVKETSSAYEAGLRTGDRIVAIDGVPTDGPFAIDRELQSMSTTDPSSRAVLELRVEGPEGDRTVSYAVPWNVKKPVFRIGIATLSNEVIAIRNTDGAASGVPSVLEKVYGISVGDRLVRVGDRAVATSLEIRTALRSVSRSEPLQVEMQTDAGSVDKTIAPADIDRFASDIAFGARVPTNLVAVADGKPAYRAGLRSGDRVLSIGGKDVDTLQDIIREIGRWRDKNDASDAESIEGLTPVVIVYERAGETLEASVVPQREYLPNPDFSRGDFRESVRADGIVETCSLGLDRTVYYVKNVLLVLDRMVRGTVSPENMGGIVMISQVSYHFAQIGIAKLFFFLGLLSVNLAILNLLPIPVLDGGQLLFLLIEKIKGSPVSERVQQYAALIGVAMILFLVTYVTYNDIRRIFF